MSEASILPGLRATLGLRSQGEPAEVRLRRLAAAGHDLRQPLQAANLFLAVLQNREDEEERRLVLDKLQQSLGEIESLLNALLDLSTLGTGTVPGKGSTPACEIPARVPAAAPALGGADDTSQASAMIAVIDDDAGVREGLGLLLSDWGHVAIIGGSAEEVVEKLERLAAWPDLIIADYRLAGGSTGIEAIDLIRLRAGRPIAAIVLTGDTAPERLIAARRKGYTLLHKPIGREHLQSALETLLERRRAVRDRLRSG